jgi:hypothetical protein
VNIRMISQGASEINISFVVKESDVPKAVRHLHEQYFPAATSVKPDANPARALAAKKKINGHNRKRANGSKSAAQANGSVNTTSKSGELKAAAGIW